MVGASREERMKRFDEYWEKLLLPTGTFSDIYAWAHNDRFRAVARLEFLRSRYADTEKYKYAERILTVENDSSLRSKRKLRTDRLLSRKRIIEVFGIEDWNWNTDLKNLRPHNLEERRKNEIMESRLKGSGGQYELTSPVKMRCSGNSIVDEHGDIELWDLEDVLEVGGCCVHGRSEFNLFAEENHLYEVLSEDYINALADLVLDLRKDRFQERNGLPNSSSYGDYVIVEIGAGSGALSHYLRKRIYELEHKGLPWASEIDVIATDSGSWKLDSRDFSVEPYTVKEALERLNPDLVITSWMPAGVDWSKAFRRAGISDYLLIGEADDGCTGHNWFTWGNKAYNQDIQLSKIGGRSISTPFAEDGYVRKDLGHLARLQLQRYDCQVAPNQSTTVLFSRK